MTAHSYVSAFSSKYRRHDAALPSTIHVIIADRTIHRSLADNHRFITSRDTSVVSNCWLEMKCGSPMAINLSKLGFETSRG